MKTFYLIVLFLTTSASIQAQTTGSISGTIKTSDGDPAEFVNVSLKGTAKGDVADKNGNYIINNISPGSYTLVASFVGLENQQQTIDVRAGEKILVDFTLKENSKELQVVVVSGLRDSYKLDHPSQSLRLNTPLLETPQNIQVVTREVLKDQQVISMSD